MQLQIEQQIQQNTPMTQYHARYPPPTTPPPPTPLTNTNTTNTSTKANRTAMNISHSTNTNPLLQTPPPSALSRQPPPALSVSLYPPLPPHVSMTNTSSHSGGSTPSSAGKRSPSSTTSSPSVTFLEQIHTTNAEYEDARDTIRQLSQKLRYSLGVSAEQLPPQH